MGEDDDEKPRIFLGIVLTKRLTVQLKLLFICCLFEADFVWITFYHPENASERYFFLTQAYAAVFGPIGLVFMMVTIVSEQFRRK